VADEFEARTINLAQRGEVERAGLEARERMVRSNLRLVVKIAKGFQNRGMPLADIVEEGNLGLLRAVECFDPEQGTRFSTYASWWIKQAIKRALINAVQPVHIPAYMVEMISRWRQAQRDFTDANGRSPSITELAKAMELPERKVQIIRRAVRAFTAPTQDAAGGEGVGLGDLLADERTPSPESRMLGESETKMIRNLLDDHLDQREATILRLRYGLEAGREPMTLKDIGAEIGLTRERVRQIEAEARKKLSEALQDLI
jgi:RNA polymerase primary sigma factor